MTETTETTRALTESTIRDIGEQWTIYSDNEGKDLYPARELFADVVGPLMDPRNLEGKRVAEINAGTGRIVQMMLDWGAALAVAVEPSDAVNALRKNLARHVAIRSLSCMLGEKTFQKISNSRLLPRLECSTTSLIRRP